MDTPEWVSEWMARPCETALLSNLHQMSFCWRMVKVANVTEWSRGRERLSLISWWYALLWIMAGAVVLVVVDGRHPIDDKWEKAKRGECQRFLGQAIFILRKRGSCGFLWLIWKVNHIQIHYLASKLLSIQRKDCGCFQFRIVLLYYLFPQFLKDNSHDNYMYMYYER